MDRGAEAWDQVLRGRQERWRREEGGAAWQGEGESEGAQGTGKEGGETWAAEVGVRRRLGLGLGMQRNG